MNVRKLHGCHREHPVFQALVAHPNVKGIVGALLGQEAILSSQKRGWDASGYSVRQRGVR